MSIAAIRTKPAPRPVEPLRAAPFWVLEVTDDWLGELEGSRGCELDEITDEDVIEEDDKELEDCSVEDPGKELDSVDDWLDARVDVDPEG